MVRDWVCASGKSGDRNSATAWGVGTATIRRIEKSMPKSLSSLHAVSFSINDLRRLDLMVMSKEARRDNAYREIERRREVFARKLRRAVDRLEDANAEYSDDASLAAKHAA